MKHLNCNNKNVVGFEKDKTRAHLEQEFELENAENVQRR